MPEDKIPPIIADRHVSYADKAQFAVFHDTPPHFCLIYYNTFLAKFARASVNIFASAQIYVYNLM